MLLAAQEWGCPPWQIAGGNKLVWYLRWQAWREQVAKKLEAEQNARR